MFDLTLTFDDGPGSADCVPVADGIAAQPEEPYVTTVSADRNKLAACG
jgi:hypothetical protein